MTVRIEGPDLGGARGKEEELGGEPFLLGLHGYGLQGLEEYGTPRTKMGRLPVGADGWPSPPPRCTAAAHLHYLSEQNAMQVICTYFGVLCIAVR